MALPITPNDLERWFSYHPPRDGQRERYAQIRKGGFQLARLIYEVVPPGDDQADALDKLREVIWRANAGIALEGPVQSAYFARKLLRKRVGTSGDDEGYTREPEEFEETEADLRLALYRPEDDGPAPEESELEHEDDGDEK